MAETVNESRHLPPEHAKRMSQLEAGGQILDGRSRVWVERLLETGFVDAEIKEDETKTIITVSLNDRGKYALERDKRGVDPYLRMTE